MAVYKCTVCGYVYDEEKEGKPFSQLEKCPVCGAKPEKFVLIENDVDKNITEQKTADTASFGYPSEYAREDLSCRYMKEIHERAVSGKTISASMAQKCLCRLGMIYLFLVHSLTLCRFLIMNMLTLQQL